MTRRVVFLGIRFFKTCTGYVPIEFTIREACTHLLLTARAHFKNR
jgi:hypothetical protein